MINTDLALDAVGLIPENLEVQNFKILERMVPEVGANVRVNSHGQAEIASETMVPVVQLLSTMKECPRPLLTKDLNGIKTLEPIKYHQKDCVNVDDGFLVANAMGRCDETDAQFFAEYMGRKMTRHMASERATLAYMLYSALKDGVVGGYYQSQSGIAFAGTPSYVPSFDFTTGTYANVASSFNLAAGVPVDFATASAEDIRSYLHKVVRTIRSTSGYQIWLSPDTMDCLRKKFSPIDYCCDPSGAGMFKLGNISFYELDEQISVINELGGVSEVPVLEPGEMFVFGGNTNFQIKYPKHTIPEISIDANGVVRSTPLGETRVGPVTQISKTDCGNLQVNYGNLFYVNPLAQTMAFVKTNLEC